MAKVQSVPDIDTAASSSLSNQFHNFLTYFYPNLRDSAGMTVEESEYTEMRSGSCTCPSCSTVISLILTPVAAALNQTSHSVCIFSALAGSLLDVRKRKYIQINVRHVSSGSQTW